MLAAKVGNRGGRTRDRGHERDSSLAREEGSILRVNRVSIYEVRNAEGPYHSVLAAKISTSCR